VNKFFFNTEHPGIIEKKESGNGAAGDQGTRDEVEEVEVHNT